MRNKVEKLVIGGSAFVLVGVGAVFGLAMSGQAAERQEPTVTVQPTETLPVVTVPAATPTVTAAAPAPALSTEVPANPAPIVEPVTATPEPEPSVQPASTEDWGDKPVPPASAGVPNPPAPPTPGPGNTDVEKIAEPLSTS